MLDDIKVKKIKELGFDVSEKGRNGECFVSLQSIPAKDIVIKLLKIFTFEDWISFWELMKGIKFY